MSELKVYRNPKDGPAYREFYEKSEADKVIAEKDAEIAELKEQVHDYALGSYVMQARAEKEARHYKYKRCLAMAELCRAKRDEIIARTPTLILNHPTEYLTRWENRWLELAENFKEAK